jgi:creatinine amidohydrolase
MPIFAAEELTYTKVRELNKTRTLCFMPVSALEVHGPHLPLGMDFYMARWMAEESGRRFAQRHPDWSVVQYPPLPLGADELPLAGSMHAKQSTVYSGVRMHGESLARAGFEYIVVTNGHGGPRHASALEAACRSVSKRLGVQMFSPSIAVLHEIVTGKHFAAIETHLGRELTDAEKEGMLCGEHAGAWETSFMLAQNPGLVEPDYTHLKRNAPPPFRPLITLGNWLAAQRDRRGGNGDEIREMAGRLAGGVGWYLNTKYGYGGPAVSYQGTPAVASAEIGAAFRDLLAGQCLRWIEDVVEGRKGAAQVRSIASNAAVVQPGFWSRIGIAAAVIAALPFLF